MAAITCDGPDGSEPAHTHGAAGSATTHSHDEPDPVAVTSFTERVELFVEHPQLVVGQEAEFLAHLTVLATGEPVRTGTLTFEVSAASGDVQRSVWDAPRRDGLFVPTWTPTAPGTYRLRLILDSPQVRETITLDELIVHSDTHAAAHAAEADAVAATANLVPFLMEQQWKVKLLLQRVQTHTLTERLAVAGEIAARPDAAAIVSPPVGGRLVAPEGGFPRIGSRVAAGQVLAMVELPLPATEVASLQANRAQVRTLAMELALRELDLDIKASEVKRSIGQAEARLAFARNEMQRMAKLREDGVGTEQAFEAAQRDLRVAAAEHEAAVEAQRSYGAVRERLQQLLAATQPHDLDQGMSAALRMPIAAPLAGEVVIAQAVAGQQVAAHETLFRIVDSDPIWLVAHVSEFDLGRVAEKPGAAVRLPGTPGQRIDIASAGGRLVHVGSVVDEATRTVALRYELPNPDRRWRVGMFADVAVETRRTVDAVAIPAEAVVMDNGQPVAFVLHDGENFERRELVLGIRDGGLVEVKSGIAPGERVATRGAVAVKLASLAPASIGHGHAH